VVAAESPWSFHVPAVADSVDPRVVVVPGESAEIVGAPVPDGGVVTKLTAEALEVAEVGPGLMPSVTEPAESRGCTVPAEQPVTTMSNVVPDVALGVNTQPVAVPAFAKSDALRPEIPSDMLSVKCRGLVAVFVPCPLAGVIVAEGTV
jgi:hypothetical protein